MVRKLIEFPPFDIIKLYKELKEKRMKVFKWVEEEIERLLYIRTLTAEVEMKCCKDGEIIYSPEPRTFEVSEENVFFDTLEEWVKNRGKQLEDQAKELSENECSGMGTPRLCNFKFTITDFKEENIKEAQ